MTTKSLLILTLFASGWAQAEQGCAAGFFPGGAQPNGPVCVPISGYGTTNNTTSVSPSLQQPRWANRWGAIAMDYTLGKLGTASDMSSRRKAENAAIAQCHSNGGSNECKRGTISWGNGCGVIAWGASYASVRSAETVEAASIEAMKVCKQRTTDCQIYYTDCNLPEREQ